MRLSGFMNSQRKLLVALVVAFFWSAVPFGLLTRTEGTADSVYCPLTKTWQSAKPKPRIPIRKSISEICASGALKSAFTDALVRNSIGQISDLDENGFEDLALDFFNSPNSAFERRRHQSDKPYGSFLDDGLPIVAHAGTPTRGLGADQAASPRFSFELTFAAAQVLDVVPSRRTFAILDGVSHNIKSRSPPRNS